jgi:hypothetical protein
VARRGRARGLTGLRGWPCEVRPRRVSQRLLVQLVKKGPERWLRVKAERVLRPAEHKLGLSSPFDVGGRPLVVPIQHVKSLVGC